jgi:hypothetical protein
MVQTAGRHFGRAILAEYFHCRIYSTGQVPKVQHWKSSIFSRVEVNAYLRAPVPILLVDGDVRILYCNDAAKEWFSALEQASYLQRTGEALHCSHSTDVPEGCGRAPACLKCSIRSAVANAAENGRSTVCKRVTLRLRDGANIAEQEVVISASPFSIADSTVVMLMISRL